MDTPNTLDAETELALSTSEIENYEAGVRLGLEDNKAHIADVRTLWQVDSDDATKRSYARGYFDGLVKNWGDTGASLQYGPGNNTLHHVLHRVEEGGRITKISTLKTSLFRGGLLQEVTENGTADAETAISIRHIALEGMPVAQYHFSRGASGTSSVAVNMFVIARSLEGAVEKFSSRVGIAVELKP